jgi:hypothetical protein
MDAIKTIQYRNHTIKVYQDIDAQNPLTEWDGITPCIHKSNGYTTDYSNGEILDYILSKPTVNQWIRHQKKILEIANYDYQEFMEEFEPQDKDEKADYLIHVLMDEILDFDQLEQLCDLFKIPCLNTSWTGYVQSSWGDLFFAFTPEFEELTGVTEKECTLKSIKSDAETVGAYFRGDVYGYVNEGELSDESVWGYYDQDHMIKEAKSNIDYAIAENLKNHINTVKKQIINKVPLGYREPALAGL